MVIEIKMKMIPISSFLPHGLSGRRGVVVACICPSVRPSAHPHYHIKTLQEEFAKKSNIPWIWRIIYGRKLPYIKKTRNKKQVCGAACFMAAEIKFSKDVHELYFVHMITRHIFELESSNLWQICILGYSQLVLKIGVIDLDLQGHFGHFNLELQEIRFVLKITRHRFGMESANLHQICIFGYSCLVLKMRVIDLELQGHFGYFDLEFYEIWFVQSINLHRFELDSPNLHQTCILGYSGLVLKIRVIDLDFQGRIGHFDLEF